jgi:hypothetical protein
MQANAIIWFVKPSVIMNRIRLRGLAVAGSNAAGRKSRPNHAQTAEHTTPTAPPWVSPRPHHPRRSRTEWDDR